MASKKRRPQPCGDCGASENVNPGGFDFSEDKQPRPISQPRPLGPGELARLTELARLGINPPEIGGDRR